MSLQATKWAWKATSLRPLHKLVLLALADRADINGIAYPSYTALIAATGIDRKTVAKALSILKQHGLIHDTQKRKGVTKQVRVFKLIGIDTADEELHKGNGSENGTSNSAENGTRNLPEESIRNHKPKWKDQAVEVLTYLNERAGHKFRPTDTNLKFIIGRLTEGYTADECKQVVDAKDAEWRNDQKMNKYLRPSTLFNREKFNQYVGQIDSGPKNDDPFAGAI